MNVLKFLAAVAALGTANAYCADLTITNFKLDSVAVIAVPTGYQLAGNMEIAITGGFAAAAAAANLKCSDTYYVTTRQSADPDRAMLSLLDDIRSSPTAADSLTITDDTTYSAFPNRCSLKSVGR